MMPSYKGNHLSRRICSLRFLCSYTSPCRACTGHLVVYQIASMIDAVSFLSCYFDLCSTYLTSELLYGVWVLVHIILLRDTLERKEENIFSLEIATG